MEKRVCTICGYIYEGENFPKVCPVCKEPKNKFEIRPEKLRNLDKYRIGIAKYLDEDMVNDLRENFTEECNEVGMYLAMSHIADAEGYSEIAETYKIIAYEEAEHAAKFAQFLGEIVNTSTKQNLKDRIEAEYGATDKKLKIARKAKELGLDMIYDTVQKMCKDEARHSKVFLELLNRYFE